MEANAGKFALTGTEHSNPEDPEFGVLREPDLEGPGLLEEAMERENEGNDAQADVDEVDAEDAGVEPEVVPVKNVDGNGFYIDDKSDFHFAVDEAVAAHRHDVVRMGRVNAQMEARKSQRAREIAAEKEDDRREADQLMNEDGFGHGQY